MFHFGRDYVAYHSLPLLTVCLFVCLFIFFFSEHARCRDRNGSSWQSFQGNQVNMTNYTEVVISAFDKAPFPFPIRLRQRFGLRELLEENLSQSYGFRKII